MKSITRLLKFSLVISLWVQGGLTELYADSKLMLPESGAKSGTLGLTRLKAAQLRGEWKTCVSLAPQVFRQNTEVQDWVLLAWIRCARAQALLAADTKALEAALRELASVRSAAQGWPSSSRPQLVSEILAGAFYLIETKKQSGNKDYAWLIEAIDSFSVTSEQRAKLFFEQGQLAFSLHRHQEAKWFFLRAQKLKASDETLGVLNQVLSVLNEPLMPLAVSPSGFQPDSEKRIFESYMAALGRKDLLPVFQEGMKYLRQFPGGAAADQIGQQLLQRYSDLVSRNQSSKDRVLRVLLSAPPQVLEKWFKHLHRRGDYASAQVMAEGYLKSDITEDALFVAGRSAFFQGKYSQAEGHFVRYAEMFSKGKEIEDVLLKLGFSHIRREEFSSAISWLQRLLMSEPSSSIDLIARYWLIRSREALDPKAQTLESHQKDKTDLISKYPFSYYGLKLQAEQQSGVLKLPTSEKKPSLPQKEWKLLPSDQQRWQRVRILAQHAWLDEVNTEIRGLQFGTDEQVQLRLIDAFKQWQVPSGVSLVLNDWLGVDKVAPAEWVRGAYPKVYEKPILAEAQTYRLNPILLWSLIRQESLFLPMAQSTSNAIGLMQVIPGTAREVAAQLKKPLVEWDLEGRVPDLNIAIGTRYIRDMIKRFDSSVPLALAAYNYGPTRLKTWVAARPEVHQQSGAFADLWIDELPASETQFYVKAILRNILIYQALDSSQVTYTPQFWSKMLLDNF